MTMEDKEEENINKKIELVFPEGYIKANGKFLIVVLYSLIQMRLEY
jgi:hypothetical protein